MEPRREHPLRARRHIALQVFAAVTALLISLAVAPAADAAPTVDTTRVKTADLSQFKPGNIVSDAVFYNSSTMSESDIQTFLNSKVSSCRSGYTCLKDKTDTTRSIAADAMCSAYSGGGTESAARIIAKVARACGINPQVLIVMLQKEQGLVTDTWPTTGQYRAAMGQGCPDTAACDAEYYGFFNQVHGAAWQLKRYENPTGTSKFFTWYAPGKTWNVQYHPNSACGSAPVYIENKATAALYYYTPYQPNSAALAAGYGLGDSCSAYGNRNFFQYFTDWFGSTQVSSSASGLLSAVGPDIYLVSGGVHYHITAADWPAYRAALGDPAQVSAEWLGTFADGGDATRFLRDSAKLTVSYLDGGKLHRFATCDLVAQWGGSCDRLTSLSGTDFARIGTGAEMTQFARVSTGGLIYRIASGTLTPYADDAAAAAANGGTVPYAAVMSAAAVARYTVARVSFAPGVFVSAGDDPRVWLPTADGRLLYLPSWTLASDLGLAQSARRVSSAALTGYRQAGSISAIVSCGGQGYLAVRGTLVAAAVDGDFGQVDLGAENCAVLKKDTTQPKAPLFVSVDGATAVYHATGGVLRHVATTAQLSQLAGGGTARIVRIPKATFARFTVGQPYLLTGELVKSPSSARVYLYDGTRLLYVPSFAVVEALGLSTAVRTVPDLTVPSGVTNLSATVGCNGVTYTARSGTLRAAGTATGRVDLSPALCGLLRIAG
ncbi:hypothetical protein [Microbacterium sp.]|uniref:hypothetical protein n=1 Tax=Microbacterium sp. TaxID=51671 RepID=UPI0039E5289B